MNLITDMEEVFKKSKFCKVPVQALIQHFKLNDIKELPKKLFEFKRNNDYDYVAYEGNNPLFKFWKKHSQIEYKGELNESTDF